MEFILSGYQSVSEFLRQIHIPTVFASLAFFMLTLKIMLMFGESAEKKNKGTEMIQIYKENKSGFVWVNGTAINPCRREWHSALMLEPFPEELRKYIRPVKLGLIRDWMRSLEVRNSEDIRRSITVSTMLYKGAIPRALMLFDARTITFYDRIRCELELQQCSLEQLERFHRQTVPAIFEASLPNLLDVATLVLGNYVTRDYYPYLEAFMDELPRNGFHGHVSKDELRSVITALAIKFELKIPADYIRHDAYTLAALKTNQTAVETAHRSLAVVR